MKKYTVILFVFIIFFSCENSVKEKKSANTGHLIQKSIQERANSFLKNELINSISIGVYKDGETYSGHFGVLDKGIGNTANDSTLYSIASITKTMTGTLVAKAVTENKLTLNDNVRDYLDGPYPNLEYKGSPIKIKHLLTHMSGLKTDPKGYDRMFEQNDFTIPYPKESFFDDLKTEIIDTIPGTKYNYSNIGALLTSYILESIYEKSFEDLLFETILEKAKMNQTRLKLDEIDRKKLVLGYSQGGEKAPYIPLTLSGAEGQVKSTMSDLMKYIKYHLNNNDLIIQESHRIVNKERWMGYFWQLLDDGDVFYLQHFGNAPGTTTYLAVYPKYNMGLSVITNVRGANNLLYYDLVQKLLDDIRPSGKSIYNVLKMNNGGVNNVIANYHQLKVNKLSVYNFSNSNELNRLGYDYLNQNKLSDAIQIFLLNTKEFPNSYNVFDSLGEAYFKDQNYLSALKAYEKSLKLNPKNANAKEKIKKIKSI